MQQMVEHGKLLFPLENGRVPMYKPPLFHWTATAIDRVSGAKKVTAFNLRLPSALYAVAGVIVTMLLAYDLLGLEAAVLAGLTLAGAFQYITLGRFGRVDMTLAFYEALSLFAFFWWIGPKPTEHPSFAQKPSASDAVCARDRTLTSRYLAKRAGRRAAAPRRWDLRPPRTVCEKHFVGFRSLQ